MGGSFLQVRTREFGNVGTTKSKSIKIYIDIKTFQSSQFKGKSQEALNPPNACETNCPSDLARLTRREQRIMSISGVFFCSRGPLSSRHFQTLAKPTAPVIWHD